MRFRRYAIAMATFVSLIFVSAPIASATVPTNGWGFGLADDDAIGSPILPPDSVDNVHFDHLDPKIFRFQVYWDAVNTTSTTDFIDKARALITRVEAAGVEDIAVTFKRHQIGQETPEQPTAKNYKDGITHVIQQLGDKVDVWGPANEPNAGETWLGGSEGAKKLAEYNTKLIEVVNALDPTALRTSPDFVQPTELSSLETYLDAYVEAGGSWGHVVAFHPYKGVKSDPPSLAGVNMLANESPSDKPIWITELGADYNQPWRQIPQIEWMVNTLANHSRVARIYYYHMRGGNPAWDTALLNNDLTRRASWYIWCAAAHGHNPSHPDCTNSGGGPTVPHWFLRNTNTAGYADAAFTYGNPGDLPIAGDWNGDGVDSPGVVRGGNAWYLKNSNSGGFSDISFTYGNPTGMAAVTGDWNNDGIDTPGMFTTGASAGTWYLRNFNSGGASNLSFVYGSGTSGPVPIPGDWNGTGDDTPGIRVGNNWYLRNSNTGGFSEINFGYGNLSGHIALKGDWDGDGDDTPGVYDVAAGKFHLRNSNSGGAADISFQYGNPGDKPVVGDWNNDGKDTIGVVREMAQ